MTPRLTIRASEYLDGWLAFAAARERFVTIDEVAEVHLNCAEVQGWLSIFFPFVSIGVELYYGDSLCRPSYFGPQHSSLVDEGEHYRC